jgi:transposase-like protein
MAVCCKGAHFPQEIMLMGVRWYVAYPLSTRHVEALMEERGVEVDHSTRSKASGSIYIVPWIDLGYGST